MTVSILAIATAVPKYKHAQEKIAEKLVEALSHDSQKAEAIRKLYRNSAIQTRYSVIPDFTKDLQEWHFWGSEFPKKIPGTAKRNELYKIEAPKLAYNAATKALESWGGNCDDISHVISVSCTGMVAPGIECELMRLLNLKSTIQRLGINFMGCFGAFKGLSVAESFAKENPKHRVLLVCTELCSLHFQVDQTPDNVLANSLFSDGAAAVVVGADPQPSETSFWEIHNKGSLVVENTSEKMKWEAGDHGFIMKLSHTVPVLVGRQIDPFVHSLVGSHFPFTNCDWAIHPGGKSIIQSIEKMLKLEENAARASWDTLANYGNMSSASFLFVLNRLMEQKSSKKWTVGLGFGPGLSLEGILLSNTKRN